MCKKEVVSSVNKPDVFIQIIAGVFFQITQCLQSNQLVSFVKSAGDFCQITWCLRSNHPVASVDFISPVVFRQITWCLLSNHLVSSVKSPQSISNYPVSLVKSHSVFSQITWCLRDDDNRRRFSRYTRSFISQTPV